MKTIKLKIYDKTPFFICCECGNKYKNTNHRWYKKHIERCPAHKKEEDFDVGTVEVKSQTSL